MLQPPWNARIYRNRHGRGTRTPMFGTRLPRYRTRTGMFDDMVAAQVRRLGQAWPELIRPLQFAVEDVPPSDPTPWQTEPNMTSQCFPGSHGIPELLAIMVIVLLHVWKRNMLLSIAGGTAAYMLLVQLVFS